VLVWRECYIFLVKILFSELWFQVEFITSESVLWQWFTVIIGIFSLDTIWIRIKYSVSEAGSACLQIEGKGTYSMRLITRTRLGLPLVFRQKEKVPTLQGSLNKLNAMAWWKGAGLQMSSTEQVDLKTDIMSPWPATPSSLTRKCSHRTLLWQYYRPQGSLLGDQPCQYGVNVQSFRDSLIRRMQRQSPKHWKFTQYPHNWSPEKVLLHSVTTEISKLKH